MKLRRSRRGCWDGTRTARGGRSNRLATSPCSVMEWCFGILSLRIKRAGPLGLLASRVDGNPGVAAGRGVSPGSANRSYLSAVSAAAEELLGAIGLEPRHACTGRHLEALQYFSRLRIDMSQLARVIFPGAVPEFSVNPGDAGDEAVGFYSAKNLPRFRIDLMDLPARILPHPEPPFGPREP